MNSFKNLTQKSFQSDKSIKELTNWQQRQSHMKVKQYYWIPRKLQICLKKQWWKNFRSGNPENNCPSSRCKIGYYKTKRRHRHKSAQRFYRKIKPFQKIWDNYIDEMYNAFISQTIFIGK